LDGPSWLASVFSVWKLAQAPKAASTLWMKPSPEYRLKLRSPYGCQMKPSRSFKMPRKK
jgi:hypothetical protein